MESQVGSNHIQVAVRVRPLTSLQQELESPVSVQVVDHGVLLRNQTDIKHFEFDYSFQMESTQRLVYDSCITPIVQTALGGQNGTVITYGQSGSGKYFTMVGDRHNPELAGIIPQACHQIISHVKMQNKNKYSIYCSFILIYNESIIDLFATSLREKKKVRQNNQREVYIQGLVQIQVKSVQQMLQIFQKGQAHKSAWHTNMGTSRSRSTNIFKIRIEFEEVELKVEVIRKKSYLNFVNLAGSEKIKKVGMNGQIFGQAISIGKQLCSLGNVISSLGNQTKHVPYRDSLLTRLLQDSLGGTAKTLMLINICPLQWNYQQTLSSLRFGSRARNVKNHIKAIDKVQLTSNHQQEKFQNKREHQSQKQNVQKKKNS